MSLQKRRYINNPDFDFKDIQRLKINDAEFKINDKDKKMF